jgi:serine/threonine protein phosphatase PrpC
MSHSASHSTKFIGYFQSIGERGYQEDNFAFKKDKQSIHVAVFDGHGGAEVSNLLKETFVPNIRSAFKRTLSAATTSTATAAATAVANTIQSVVRKIDKHIAGKSAWNDTGSTLLYVNIALSPEQNKFSVTNIGDSRCIGCTNSGEVVANSRDHKPSDSAEHKRIKKLGFVRDWDDDDKIYRIAGYAVSRAVGDHTAKEALCSQIEYKEFVRSDFKFLVVATDGLWDSMSNQQVVDFVSKRYDNSDSATIAKELVRHAQKQKRSPGDNMTVVLIPLSKMKALFE